MAKRKLIAVTLIGLMVVAGGSYFLYANLIQGGEGENFVVNLPIPAAPVAEVSFELSADFPQVGDRAMVYKVKPPEVTVEKVTELGRRLGLQGEAEACPEMVSMIDESGGQTRWVGVWVASGAVEYGFVGDSFMDKLYPPTPPTLPSEEEAKEIATQFLAQYGLLPAGAYASEVVPGGSSSVANVTHLLVRFAWEINGFPATNTKFSVRIGDGGEVVKLYIVWREVEPYREISIKAPQEAYQELLAGGGSYLVPSECQKMVVEKISLAYWMEFAPDKQEYVVPVYEFKGKCLDGEGNYLQDFTAWCQATG